MIDPTKLVDRIVEMLRSIPELTQLLNNDPQSIKPFYDEYPGSGALTDAIYDLRPPGILVIWDGTQPVFQGSRELWNHQIRLVLKASEKSVPMGGGYSSLFKAVVDGIPENGDGQKFRMSEIHLGVYPIGSMSVARSYLLVDPATNSTLDYFEVTFSLKERGDY